MKKIVLCALIAAIAGLSVNAEYLLWQVDDSFGTFTPGTDYYVGLFDNTGARIDRYIGTLAMGGAQATSISSAADSYYIEVYSYEATGEAAGTVGASQKRGESWSYKQLVDAGAIVSSGSWTSGSISNNMAVWTGSKVVPEPTSGLMVLVGMALLGLKRRRA